MSDLDIIAPIRELNLTRTEEQAYAEEKGQTLTMSIERAINGFLDKEDTQNKASKPGTA